MWKEPLISIIKESSMNLQKNKKYYKVKTIQIVMRAYHFTSSSRPLKVSQL